MANEFSSGLGAGFSVGAGIRNQRRLDRAEDLASTQRRAEEFARGLDAIDGPAGSGDMSLWNEQQLIALNDHMNAYKDVVGDRPGGTPTFLKMHQTGRGVAAEVEVTDPKTGATSRGPITKKGSNSDDDEVVTLTNTSQLKDPVIENAQRALMTARTQSQSAHDMTRTRENRGATNNAFETLNNRFNQGPAGPAVQVPGQPDPQPAPAPEDGPARGLREAAANPSAVTSPARAPAPIAATPTAATGFKYTGPSLNPGINDAVAQAATQAGLDPALVQAVVQHESRGDPTATSATGASGLMQITKSAVDEVNRLYGTSYTRDQMRTDSAANLDVGTKYLKHLMTKYDGNVEQALAAYNGGPGHLRNAGGDYTKTKKETREYVPKVLAFLTGGGEAQAEVPSAEPQGLSTATSAPSTQTPERRRDARNLEGLRSAVSTLQKNLGATGRTDDASVLAERAKLEQAETALAKAEASYAEGGGVPGTIEEALGTSAAPKNEAEAKVVAEIEATPPPASEEEVKVAVTAVQGTKPGKKWTDGERQALYALHHLNPQQFPMESVVSALSTGRVTKTKLQFIKNAADQIIAIDESGQQTVLPETQAAIDVRNAALQKAQRDANYNAQKDQQALEAGQRQATKDRTDFFLEQNVNLHGDDPQRKAQLRDQYNVTIDTMGLNADQQGTVTAINSAARIQKLFADDNGPGLFNLWLKDEPYFNDFSFGMAVQNMPNSPYDPASPDDDEVKAAGNYYQDNYLEPMVEQFPALGKQQAAQATYAATHIEKRGIPREDAIRIAGQLAQHSRFANVGDMISAIDRKIAQQAPQGR